MENDAAHPSAVDPRSVQSRALAPAVAADGGPPLISVIVRSMDRPMLAEALESVAVQTYPNIEVVLVSAKGPGHGAFPECCGRFPLRLIETHRPLPRAGAANAGLDAAGGQFLMFLDDDDLLLPDHIAKLAQVLLDGPSRAAYSGVRLIDGQNTTVRVLDEPWEPKRLRGANFLPIHAVLFHRSLLEAGCRFDETLDCLEDWDFWLQLSQHTPFQHVEGVSALYRFSLGSSGLSAEADAERHLKNRAALFDKWRGCFSSREWVESFFWLETAYGYFKGLSDERGGELHSLRGQLTELQIRLAERDHELAARDRELAARDRELAVRDRELARRGQALAERDQAIAERDRRITLLDDRLADSRKTIDALVHSTSWRLTRPLRFAARLLRGQFGEAADSLRRELHHLGRTLYWRLPPRRRDSLVQLGYRWAGPLFRGLGHYELWHRRMGGEALGGAGSADLIDTAHVDPLVASPGRIAVHIHLFYADLATEFARRLESMPFPYDLFVSVPDTAAQSLCARVLRDLPNLQSSTVAVVANRGRDMAPMLCHFGHALMRYDFICHLHSKKSLYNQGTTEGWREYLLGGLLGDATHIRRIFSLLAGTEDVGLVYPQTFAGAPYMAHTWLASQPLGRAWCRRLGITPVPTGYFDFPVGSMFWARTAALRPLFEAGITLEDFPVEAGQTDATLAHCLERLLGLVVRHAGFQLGILRDRDTPSWSAWRFDQYLARRPEPIQELIARPGVRLVVFDIFDTLLTRPLLNAESLKAVVARRAGTGLGQAYVHHRAMAEVQARERAGRDVGLKAVFDAFASLSGLSEEQAGQLRCLEEAVERDAVSARPDVVALLRHAVAAGKRVVLASDMYLPRPLIETMLAAQDIQGWQALYLSSEVGLRKDSGELYRHILEQEGVAATDVLVIGDNERSDFQIPCDMGMRFCHVLRPVELARALPRFGPLVEQGLREGDLDQELALGLIVRRHFQPVFYPAFDPALLVPGGAWSIGYTVLGPLVLAFVQWLVAQAAADGTDHLYFLSREGQFLMAVYERWRSVTPDAPPATYLVLSRRVVTVAMLEGPNDIQAIAQVRSFPGPVRTLLHERYGLELKDEEIEGLVRRGLWPQGGRVEIREGDIAALQPLLQALEPRILEQARAERPGLLAYLEQMGLKGHTHCAVVDIGYSGTIQARLNRLLGHPVQGYYLLTDARAGQVSAQHGVVAQGCYGHCVDRGGEVPALLRESFTLEKLLSSDTPQVVRYRLGRAGEALPEFRTLSQQERGARGPRAEIRQGAMAFVDEVLALQGRLLPDFRMPVALASALFEAFMTHPAAAEEEVLRALVLDDHYCGRGLVS